MSEQTEFQQRSENYEENQREIPKLKSIIT